MAILKDARSASVRRVFFSAALQRIKLIFLAALYRYLLESNGAQHILLGYMSLCKQLYSV